MSDERRIALVTGASRGLGYAMAMALAQAGRHVYALARTEGGLEELDDAIAATGAPRPTLLPMDISNDDAVERLGLALLQRHGRLDEWVHTAIYDSPLAPAGSMTTRDLDRGMATNARAVPRLIEALDPALMQSESPKAVFFPDPHDEKAFWGGYHATKDAGLAFAKAWAAEREKNALQVLFHQPPPMPTKLRSRFYRNEDTSKLTPCADAAKGVMAVLNQP